MNYTLAILDIEQCSEKICELVETLPIKKGYEALHVTEDLAMPGHYTLWDPSAKIMGKTITRLRVVKSQLWVRQPLPLMLMGALIDRKYSWNGIEREMAATDFYNPNALPLSLEGKAGFVYHPSTSKLL